MKMRMGALILPSAGATPEQIEQGFAGQNPNYYQRGLGDCMRVVQQIEDLGFDFIAFTEHHFHLEGLEVSNNPVLLGTWAAMMTKRLRIAQMGNVLPARNPILLAEDLAMLDQFSEGRMCAGFARGYQSRHVMTVGQKMNAAWTAANDPDFAEHDRVNRELFNEHYEIIRKAWAQPMFKHQGKHWDIPPAGIKWDHPATQQMAPGMVSPEGELAQVGIAPQTLQIPETIETFIPFTMSAETIEWSAREGLTPIIFSPVQAHIDAAIDMYHNAAVAAGRNVERGRGIGHFREVVVADTDTEAQAIQEQGLGYIWPRWHDWFGFNEALRKPGETGEIENSAANLRHRGYSLAGSVDSVARQLEEMIETNNTDLIVPWIAAGPAPIDGLLKSNELLVEKVLPKIGIELTQRQPQLRADYDGRSWRDHS